MLPRVLRLLSLLLHIFIKQFVFNSSVERSNYFASSSEVSEIALPSDASTTPVVLRFPQHITSVADSKSLIRWAVGLMMQLRSNKRSCDTEASSVHVVVPVLWCNAQLAVELEVALVSALAVAWLLTETRPQKHTKPPLTCLSVPWEFDCWSFFFLTLLKSGGCTPQDW